MNLTAQNTAVVLDSTADFPDAPQRFPNFRVVPLYVRFGDESFRDYVDITPDQFYARLPGAAELPTTSQPTPADFLATYEELAGYERILSLQISSTLSGTFASAQTAAEMLGDGRVRVIDTRTVSASLALLAIAVQRRLERGTTDEEVDELVARYQRDHYLLFTVNTLEYLAKGGRIGRAAALAGNLLNVKPILTIRDGEVIPLKRVRGAAKGGRIGRAAALAGNLLNVKPILTIRDGEVVPLKKVRGAAKAFHEFQTMFEETSSGSPALKVGIAHAAAPERMEALRTMVSDVRPQAEIEMLTQLGAVIGTHAGPGTVGFFWFADQD